MDLLGAALQIASVILSVLLIILILLQVKGGGMDLLGGDGGGITRTRRGLERRLFQLTVGLAVAFLAISIMSVAVN